MNNPSIKPRHFLYDVDLDHETAICSVCGFTEITVSYPRDGKPKVRCQNKVREIWLDGTAKRNDLRAEKHSDPNWKPRHILTDIDPENQTAICAVCGPTDIWKTTSKGSVRYYCATKHRDYMRKYQRTHRAGRPTNPHALSQIDEENGTAVCAKCGLVKYEVWYGKKKMNRRCINARIELLDTSKYHPKVKVLDA